MRSWLAGRLAVVAMIAGPAAGAACGKTPAPGEDVTSTTLPPITICYEPDGAPCPLLDGGEESGVDAGAVDAAEAGPG
jgi:hypothetical protein